MWSTRTDRPRRAKSRWLAGGLLAAVAASATALAGPVRVGCVSAELISENRAIAPGQAFTLAVRLRMDAGWHTYAKTPGDAGRPTTIDWTLPPEFSAGEIQWPPPVRFESEGLVTYGYEDEVLLLADITPPRELREGANLVLRAHASWLACAQECAPGAADLALELPIASSTESAGLSPHAPLFAASREQAAAQHSSRTAGVAPPAHLPPGVLASAFFGGLILNLMPCVFPVLGVKVLGFVKRAGADRRKVTLYGLVFTSGVLTSFWLLAGALIALRAGGRQLGWGFQLQSPAFVFGLAVFLLAFALNLSGVFEFWMSATGVGASLTRRSGYAGAFFSGGLATVVSTPCAAPFLAPALGAALALPAWPALALFTVIALGLSSPYLALSAFPQLVKALPRPGAWMETFKQVMAFPLYGTTAFLVWVLAGQVEENALLGALGGLVLVAMAAWAYGRWAQYEGGRARWWFAHGAAALVFAAGIFIGLPRASSDEIEWREWSPEALAALRTSRKTVYVDFTARWCATCKVNKLAVFSSPQVREAFARGGVVALKADWTNQDSAITAALAAHGRSAVPFTLIYGPGADEPIVLPEVLTPAVVLDALARTTAPPVVAGRREN